MVWFDDFDPRYEPFHGLGGGFNGFDVDRRYFAPVSQRAQEANLQVQLFDC